MAATRADKPPRRLTVLITGGSRGIGLAIGRRLARDGANVALLAKTTSPHPKLPGTIYTAAAEIDAAGGRGLALECDIRSEASVDAAIAKCVATFGGLDVLINNASAISITGTLDTPMKKYDLMAQVNARGTYLCTRAALPHLVKSSHAHVLNISPPLNMSSRWFEGHTAYTMAKYGMSMCTLGMAAEFADEGVAVNSLWPATAIATAALNAIGGFDAEGTGCRTTEIMADAAALVVYSSTKTTGNFFVDEIVLRESGVTCLDKYACVPGTKKFTIDYFLEPQDLVPHRSRL